MHTRSTAITLLQRVRDPADHAAWREFHDRYHELLVRFCQRRGLQRADAEDVIGGLFAGLIRAMPQFEYDRSRGRFRDYLLRCTRNALSRWAACPQRRPGPLVIGNGDGAEPLIVSEPTAAEVRDWEDEWVAHHYRVALDEVRRTCDSRSVDIFDRSVAGAKVAELAVQLGMTEAAVYKVRQRIRTRMQELIAEQIREEDEL